LLNLIDFGYSKRGRKKERRGVPDDVATTLRKGKRREKGKESRTPAMRGGGEGEKKKKIAAMLALHLPRREKKMGEKKKGKKDGYEKTRRHVRC